MSKEFDWSDKAKEKYYKRVEKLLSENGIRDIEVDREQFGIRGVSTENRIAVIRIKRVQKSKARDSIKRIKKLKNFYEVPNKYKCKYGVEVNGIFFDGYLLIPMDGGKKDVLKKAM